MKGEIRSKQDNQTTSQSLPTCFVMKHHELSWVSKKWMNFQIEYIFRERECLPTESNRLGPPLAEIKVS